MTQHALDLHAFALFAQTESAPPIAGRESAGATGEAQQPIGGQQPQGAPQSAFGPGFLFLLMGMFVLMFVVTGMSQRKQKKQRAELLSSIARHDKVQTVGGIIGSVAEVRDDEIVLKVDEATNTKIRIARSAVQSVLKKSGAAPAPGAASAPAASPEPAGV